MFRNKKVIIFDMDGTLIDSVGIWNEIDRRILVKYGNATAASLTEKEIQLQRDELLRKHKSAKEPYSEYYMDL